MTTGIYTYSHCAAQPCSCGAHVMGRFDRGSSRWVCSSEICEIPGKQGLQSGLIVCTQQFRLNICKRVMNTKHIIINWCIQNIDEQTTDFNEFIKKAGLVTLSSTLKLITVLVLNWH